jgi:hypothetical protein
VLIRGFKKWPRNQQIALPILSVFAFGALFNQMQARNSEPVSIHVENPRIIDGDTLETLDKKRVRLSGIDAPDEDGKGNVPKIAAQLYLEELVKQKGAFAGGGGILRQARPDSRREILLVAAFYGRARKATAQFYPAMATHFEGVWPNAPILNEAERTPKSLCRFIRFQHGQPNLCGTSRSGPAFDRRVN